MVRWVVEFLDGAYKISDIFTKKSTYSEEILISCNKKKMASCQKLGTNLQNKAFHLNYYFQLHVCASMCTASVTLQRYIPLIAPESPHDPRAQCNKMELWGYFRVIFPKIFKMCSK